MERPGYYGILPASIRYDKNLKPMEKIMYSELTALSNKNGYCNATNSYFAELYEVGKNTVSLWISDLEKAGYIKTKLIYEAGTKIIKERRIYILDPITKNNDTPITKNREDNNTSINNTRLIITNNNNLENIIKDQEQEKVVINSNGALQQEIKMLLGLRKIKPYDIIKLNKPIERIKFVIDFCNKNNKADGYLFKALKDDWELKEVQQEEKPCYFTKPKEAYKELV